MARVTVSIVTYNSEHIFEAVAHFQTEVLPYYPVTLRIFDNHSTPAYVQKLRSLASKQIHITAAQDNRGFGYGHNVNLAQSHDDYFICCNPDILITQASFATMYNFIAAHPKVSMIAPKITNPDGQVQHLIRYKLDVFDYMLRFTRGKFIKRLFAKRIARYECRDLSEERQQIKFGSGAFMFLRASMMRQIGGFDERFFMYFEDNDLCMRINQAGGQIFYLPDAPVIHYYARASHKSTRGFKQFLRSMVHYFNKWGWRFF
ncbi:glycosyltransferase family 2 protein [Loigolactobacillus jiayinensis]|uniref:Glycosyltransferase family 2 protein n=1 Tax=Loigolactobacillus jiayinensis TaxID=2486016 RepID=A0ABW1R9P2_9LACO|nr:glycosyltransferase family 2 protein [Loigolactobacillus jiayinensis]